MKFNSDQKYTYHEHLVEGVHESDCGCKHEARRPTTSSE